MPVPTSEAEVAGECRPLKLELRWLALAGDSKCPPRKLRWLVNFNLAMRPLKLRWLVNADR
jgi:hypothetical protein